MEYSVSVAKRSLHILTTAMSIRVVVSLSILSMVVFYSSSMIHLHPQNSFKFKLYSLPSGTNKNFMFLLCNGILCIIFNSSGLIRSSPSLLQSSSMESAASSADKNKTAEEKIVVVETSRAEDDKSERQLEQKNHEDEENGTCDMVAVIAPDEDDEDEEMLSLEELNRKCDDFIKKMKLEIRFGDA